MVVHNKSLAITLGLLGLIPFIVLPSSITFIPDYSYLISMAFSYYSAVILAFLAGTLWHSEAAYLLWVLENYMDSQRFWSCPKTIF